MSKIITTSEIDVKLVQKVGGDHMIIAAARVSIDGQEALRSLEKDPEEGAGLLDEASSRHAI